MDKLKKEYANKLRIAKRILSGNIEGLSEKDRKIGNNILRSLKRKKVSLKDWVGNKGGVRDRGAWQKKRRGEAREVRAMSSMMGRPEIKESPIEKRQVARLKSLTPSERFDEPAYESIEKIAKRTRKPSPTKKVAKVVPRIVDTGIAFGPRTESKASVSPRGAVSKAPAVLASPSRKRKSPPPAPKRKPTQKVRKEDKPSVKLEPWSGGVATAVRPPLKPLEGGVRYKKLPDWLGGGEIKIDSSDEAFNYDNPDNVTHGQKGGQVKKGVKKTKAKARRRAALRGHRAELRGG